MNCRARLINLHCRASVSLPSLPQRHFECRSRPCDLAIRNGSTFRQSGGTAAVNNMHADILSSPTFHTSLGCCRRAGTDVGEILQATQRLAHAQSERQATACRLLPPMHWALLYTIGSLFVSTFILFETGGSFSNEGRHILFTVLCGLMSFVLCVSLPYRVEPSSFLPHNTTT